MSTIMRAERDRDLIAQRGGLVSSSEEESSEESEEEEEEEKISDALVVRFVINDLLDELSKPDTVIVREVMDKIMEDLTKEKETILNSVGYRYFFWVSILFDTSF